MIYFDGVRQNGCGRGGFVSWGRSTKSPPLLVENGGLWVKRWGLLLVLCGLMIEPLEQNEWQPYDIDRCGAQKRDEHGV